MIDNRLSHEYSSEPIVPAGRLENWCRKTVLRHLGRITWGRIRLVERGETVTLGPQDGRSQPEVTLDVIHPRFYSAVVFGGSIGLAEAYMAGLWKCSDLTGLIRILARNLSTLEKAESGPAWMSRFFHKLFHFLHRNTRLGSRRNIVAHYDLGNDFYQLFLDETLTYSCGIFETPSSTLLEASVAKYDRICRKLQLAPTDHVIEIGTGWGGFSLHAASRYGCSVTSTTISDRQYEYACRAVQQAGLQERIEILKKDYRDLTGQYDKLVSIEMIEAVGHEFQDVFFRTCSRLLKPDGRMALQAITITDQRYRQHVREVDFIKRYIFPGSCLTSITHICSVSMRFTDLRLIHFEDITPHYSRTLRCWRDNFLACLDRVRAMGFSDRFIRMWEYYLCYCEGAFHERYIGDVQMVWCKPLSRPEPILGALT
ncbi:MAG: class I SAM-dependent methyltransferase [Sedimentisphaerales bacterium]|nr:class I SAM-dependent methyltransferase [Sedimentisphaerales bacterium]